MIYPRPSTDKLLIFDTETRGFLPELGETAFCCAAKWVGSKGNIKFYDFRKQQDCDEFIDMCYEAKGFLNHNLKFDIRQVVRSLGVDREIFLSKPLYDTLLLAKHVWPGRAGYGLEDLVPEVDGLPPKNLAKDWLNKNAPKGQKRNYELLPDEILIPYACADTVRAEIVFINAMRGIDWHNHLQVDHKMIEMIVRMELNGIPINNAQIDAVKKALQVEARALEEKIPFQVRGKGSRKCLEEQFSAAAVKYRCYSKTKDANGRPKLSYDKYALETFARNGVEWAEELVRWRFADKMLTTFIKSWERFVPHSRLFPSFNIFGARTGRMSSSNPNFQQVPKRGDGKMMRRCICPEPGKVFVLCDYSQMEDWGAALMSNDANLLKALKTGDVHRGVAQQIFETDNPTPAQREIGKTFNHATKYGARPMKIKQMLETLTRQPWTIQKAKALLDKYWHQFATLERWIGSNERFARLNTPAKDPFGRRQHALRWKPYAITNYLIQGWCAGIMKRAALEVFDRGHLPWLLLHDEIGVYATEDTYKEVGQELMECMVAVEGYRFPVEASVARTSWDDKEKIGELA